MKVEQEEEKEGVQGLSCNGKCSCQSGLVPMLHGRTYRGPALRAGVAKFLFCFFFLGWNGNVNDRCGNGNWRWSGRAGFIGRRIYIEHVKV